MIIFPAVMELLGKMGNFGYQKAILNPLCYFEKN
jgi:hypothetical protein